MDRKQRKATTSRSRGATSTHTSTETGAVVMRLFAEADRCYRSGLFREAAAAYRKAIVLQPGIPGARVNLGNVLRELGQLDEAVAAYRNALALAPNLSEAHYNLAVVLRTQGNLEAARDAYRQAIALKPDLLEAHCNLGNVSRELGRLDEAEASFRSGLSLAPSDPEIHNNLAAVLHDMGKSEEAVEFYAKAVALKPDFAEAVGNLTDARKKLCDWSRLEQDEEACRSLVRRGIRGISPFQFLSLPATPAEQAQCARLQAAAVVKGTGALPAPGRKSGERLRLGYLSCDFRQHPVAELTAEMFERHDRDRFEVSAYSFGPDDRSAIRRRLLETFDRFVDLRALSYADAAQQIRADGIDILVDLTGYTDGARTPILAWRPAPIQVNFLGFLGTMGAEFIDYIIADAVTVPMAEQAFFDERIVHLPDCFMPTDTKKEMADRSPSRAECGLPEAAFVFCCFNQPYKITPPVFGVWMRLLQAVPGSVLWLLETNPAVGPNLRREAAARGIAADRLVFAQRQPLAEHLARQRVADLFIDTLPYNAHTTANVALWAGLPVLTCSGDSFVGRAAESLIRAVGLPELVTRSLGEYKSLALRLATDATLLGGIRRRLEANRPTAPLFDMARYTRHLEAAYLGMWDNWAAGKPPEAFAITQ